MTPHPSTWFIAAAAVLGLGLSGCGSETPASVPGTGILPVSTTPLTTWKSALAQCRTSVVNVIVLGDSRSMSDSTVVTGGAPSIVSTFGLRWADRLQQSLRVSCGSHGTGVVPLIPVGNLHSVNADFYTVEGTWTTNAALGPSQGAKIPMAMTLEAINGLTLQFSAHEPFDHLNAYCASGPGLNAWTMLIDGTSAGTCGGPAAGLSAKVARSTGVALATHTAALVCAIAPCDAYGLEATAGNAGVSVHNLAVGTCTAECFGLDPSQQFAYSDLIPGGPQLVITSLITNEYGVGYGPESFRSAMIAIAAHEAGLTSKPSLLIFAPLQDAIPSQESYYPVLPGVASAVSASFFDMRVQWGTGFIAAFFGPDAAHENDDGHRVIFESVQSVLLN